MPQCTPRDHFLWTQRVIFRFFEVFPTNSYKEFMFEIVATSKVLKLQDSHHIYIIYILVLGTGCFSISGYPEILAGYPATKIPTFGYKRQK